MVMAIIMHITSKHQAEKFHSLEAELCTYHLSQNAYNNENVRLYYKFSVFLCFLEYLQPQKTSLSYIRSLCLMN